MLLYFPTRNSRALPSHMARAQSPTKPYFLLCHIGNSDTIRNTSRKQSHIPSYNPTSHHTSSTSNFCLWHRASTTHIFYLWHGQRKLATATQCVSFIFGDGQRNLATDCATRIFYLWQRPAQLGDGRATRISYLWRLPAQLGDCLRNAYLLSLATASATWRRPAQFVNSR